MKVLPSLSFPQKLMVPQNVGNSVMSVELTGLGILRTQSKLRDPPIIHLHHDQVTVSRGKA